MEKVTFTGDYFVLTTFIDSDQLKSDRIVDKDFGEVDEEGVIAQACKMLKGYYGWDVAAVSNEIEVETEEDQ